MPFYDVDINKTISDDFLEYAGHVMQERSIPDARDALKDGARKILYIQYKDKNTHDKNFVKGAATVGQVLKDGFLHGDSSAYETLVRMGKRFAVPYTLQELQGNGGNQVSPDNHADMRYLEVRQSELSSYLFKGIEKNAIDEWYWNYANTKQLPRVLPTIGFYPLVNGFSGIAVGLSSSFPSTNLREVNKAIITLINNPEVDFDKIYCAPDFPMGGTVLNGDEVKESFRNGEGKAIKMQAKLEYIQNKNMIIATEIPFSVYTETIDNELLELINGEENYGIERFIDATNDEGAKIQIYLSKGANVKKVMKLLYAKTSLQSFYAINLIMLENGRFPRVFGWREALLNYISHIRICKRREVQFDLDKALARENVVDGLIMASANIDEVVALIRASDSPAQASAALIERFGFNEEQTKAILAMKLSSLTRIDAVKLQQEKEELKRQIELLDSLLADPKLLDAELIKALQEVADKFGDARRTKILNISQEEDEEPAIEERNVALMVLSNNNVRMVPQDSIEGAKKGRKGKTIPLPKNIKLMDTFYTTNMSSIYVITQSGKIYTYSLSNLVENEDFSLYELGINANDTIVKVFSATNIDYSKYLCFFTKNGMIKKTAIEEYRGFARRGMQVLKLKEDDSVIECLLLPNDNGEILTFSSAGYAVRFKHSDIAPIGRIAQGVKGMKLGENEYLVDALYVDDEQNYKGVLTISSSGRGKITPISEFISSARTTKGVVAMKMEIDETLNMASLVQSDATTINLLTGTNAVSLSISEIPVQQRNTQGNKLINLKNTTDKIKVLGR
jgi:DNA gyrase subunit A